MTYYEDQIIRSPDVIDDWFPVIGPGLEPLSPVRRQGILADEDRIRRHLDHVVTKDAKHPINISGVPVLLILLKDLANLDNGFLRGEGIGGSCLV